jgi:hypothetical protein
MSMIVSLMLFSGPKIRDCLFARSEMVVADNDETAMRKFAPAARSVTVSKFIFFSHVSLRKWI